MMRLGTSGYRLAHLLLLLLSFLLLLESGDGASNSSSKLAAEIEAVTSRPEFEGCRWGIAAHRVVDGVAIEVIYENRDAASFFTPASNLKLLACYAAWLTLGPHYRFSTPIAASFGGDGSDSDGKTDNDESKGRRRSTQANITLCASNDPSLTSSELATAARRAVLAAPERFRHLDSLSVRVDNRRGPDGTFPSSWEFGDLPYYYGAPPASVILDGNLVSVRIEAASEQGESSKANVTVLSPGGDECFRVVNQVEVVPGSSSSSGVSLKFAVREGDLCLVLNGEVAQGSDALEMSVACGDPLRRAADALSSSLPVDQSLLKGSGTAAGTVLNDAPECNELEGPRVLTTIRSRPLEELLNHTLQYSDNTYAEAILRRQGDIIADAAAAATAARWRTNTGSTYAASLAAVAATLSGDAAGTLNTSHYSSVDGSGLSRHDLVTPRFLVSLLAHADWNFVELLPLAGRTGTLAGRFQGTPAEGVLYAKTGTETHINALSGRIKGQGGGAMGSAASEVAFSILTNSCPQPSSVVRQGIDDIAVLFVGA